MPHYRPGTGVTNWFLGISREITTKALRLCNGFYVSASKSNAHCRNCLLDLDKVMRRNAAPPAGAHRGHKRLLGLSRPEISPQPLQRAVNGSRWQHRSRATIAVIACWISMGSCGHAAPPARARRDRNFWGSHAPKISPQPLFKAVERLLGGNIESRRHYCRNCLLDLDEVMRACHTAGRSAQGS
jgi:hypothetical protein